MKNFLEELNIDFKDFSLSKDDFKKHSDLHGIGHTYRVMYNCLLIGKELKDIVSTKIAFCSALIHDLSRSHDGHCEIHGVLSVYENFDKYKDLFVKYGLDENGLSAVKLAVSNHSVMTDVEKNHDFYQPVAILKDADALDRVRIDDLDPSFLRFKESIELIPKSEELFYRSFNKTFSDFSEFFNHVY